MEWLFHTHLFLTVFMTGVIWFVQIVHYPLMGQVGRDVFVDYERRHTVLTSMVVAPVMVGELATAILLAWESDLSQWFWVFNLIGVLLLWVSTFLIQVPLHNRLSRRFDTADHRALVRTNWIRTLIWTARALAMLMLND